MAEKLIESLPSDRQSNEMKEKIRASLQAVARVVVSDRRATALISKMGDVLLLNSEAKRLAFERNEILSRINWDEICIAAKRSGSVAISWTANNQDIEGEVIHIPLDRIDSYLIRMAQSDSDLSLLRHRARAAALMRVAHDLRTPIQSLLASANALIESSAQIQATPEAAHLRRAASLALDHISTVLQVIRGEKPLGASEIDEDFRIDEELRRIVALIQPIAETRNTEISCAIDMPEGLKLRGPLRHIRALFQNLIDNSVNHGGGRVALTLRCALIEDIADEEEASDENWCVELTLKDEGGGLPPAQRNRLAQALGETKSEPAVQTLAKESKRPSAGMNVMAYALKQLGGTLTVNDLGPDGQILPLGSDQRIIGTYFTVRFSLHRAPEFLAAAGFDSGERPLSGKQIILVEDSPASRDWLTHVLQSAGAEVHAVGSGPEALALISRNDLPAPIDLMLSDVTLPRMSGIELAAHLTKGDPTASKKWSAKIVGLTAHADDQIRAACLAAGMSCVLEKPIKPQLLTRILSEILLGSYQHIGAFPEEHGTESAISQQTLEDLTRQLGLERTKSFIQRALSEARHILEELRADGVGPDSGRKLHAATGSSGLTGLRLVEKRLREIETEINEARIPTPDILEALALAIDESQSIIDLLHE